MQFASPFSTRGPNGMLTMFARFRNESSFGLLDTYTKSTLINTRLGIQSLARDMQIYALAWPAWLQTAGSTFSAFNLYSSHSFMNDLNMCELKRRPCGFTNHHTNKQPSSAVVSGILLFIKIELIILCVAHQRVMHQNWMGTRHRVLFAFLARATFFVSPWVSSSHCEYGARTLLKIVNAEKSNWLDDNWQYICSRWCSRTSLRLARSIWFIYIYFSCFIWSFNYGEMWRGHTQVTLFAFVCLPFARKMRSQPPQPHNGNRKKAKIGRFSLFYGGWRPPGHGGWARRIHLRNSIDAFYTICANLFLFIVCACIELRETAGERSAIRSECKWVCGMREQRNTKERPYK